MQLGNQLTGCPIWMPKNPSKYCGFVVDYEYDLPRISHLQYFNIIPSSIQLYSLIQDDNENDFLPKYERIPEKCPI